MSLQTEIRHVALPKDAGQRLDRYISGVCGLSRAMAQKLVVDGNVLANGAAVSKSYLLQAGDVLDISIPPPRDMRTAAEEIPLDVLYEDDHLLVVNKPKGMVVHPAAGNPDGTLVNALLWHCKGTLSGIGGELRPGIVHRIDKDTSGLLVVAKDDAAHAGLAGQFAAHSVNRVYNAVVYGHMPQPQGIVDAPIGRSRRDRKKMAVTEQHSKNAVTTYNVLKNYPGFDHLELRLRTGRTHQIRVHMASVGHPVAGDAVYGPKRVIGELQGQCLHAGTLGFIHPITGRELLFEAALPDYFTGFLSRLENNAEVGAADT